MICRRGTTRPLALTLIALVLVVVACGDDDQAPAATDAPASSSLQPTTVPPTSVPTTTTPPVVAIVSVEDGVPFYPACGNETLDHDGVTWFPVAHVGFSPYDEELTARLEEIGAVPREPSPVQGVNGLARVVAPGPGDDVGTLVVWADGVARWVSDSGTLDVWMVDDELTYNWVC